MLVVAKMTRQTKFNPICRFDPKDPDSIEVRVEGFDTISLTLTKDQYRLLRDSIGKFNPGAGSPPPQPKPSSDDWSN